MDKQPQIWEEVLRAVNNGQQPTEAQWHGLTPGERELIESLRQQALTSDAVAFMGRVDEDRAWRRLKSSARLPTQLSGRVIRMRLLRYAAIFAGVVVLGAGAVFFLRKSDAPRPVIAGTYITPPANHKRAMLVLDDGRRVELDKIPDSRIQQGQAEIEIVNADTSSLRYVAGTGTIHPAGFNTLIIPRGGEYKIQLADGTEVWLNAETQLRYPAHFGGSAKREVFLEAGEAYFKVAPNAGQPFVVRTGGMDIQVLGTEFNINTYTREYATTLVNGSVRVSAGGAGTLLRPDQQAVYTGGGFTRMDVDVEPYVAWREGQMIFTEASLEDVMSSIARQYDFKVEFMTPQLKGRRFGGRLRKTQHIEDILAVIGKVGEVQFSIKEKTIFVGEALYK
ncbi:MAG: FecR domain-containing protein [Chitinophagaceae bacterium]|nr:FecR domain-containing protein [Chitinophagaceae bacterium]